MKEMKLNGLKLLSHSEMREVIGGYSIISGTRYSGGSCYCDYTFFGTNPDGSTNTWTLCDSPCSSSFCKGTSNY